MNKIQRIFKIKIIAGIFMACSDVRGFRLNQPSHQVITYNCMLINILINKTTISLNLYISRLLRSSIVKRYYSSINGRWHVFLSGDLWSLLNSQRHHNFKVIFSFDRLIIKRKYIIRFFLHCSRDKLLLKVVIVFS